MELVPGFKQSDNRFKYPDTHDGGSWKYTDPMSEQEECDKCNTDSNGIYYDFCHILRSWKNTIGFEMGGLLIDTLVYNFFQDNDCFSDSDSGDYLHLLTEIYKYLKNEDPDKKYWLAVGSNQQVYNKENGAFVAKAKKAYNKLDGTTETTPGINDILRDLLGNDFPEAEGKTEKSAQYGYVQKSVSKFNRGAPSEQFIEELVLVDIRYYLQLDCKVTQDGWRPFLFRAFLRDGQGLLRHNKGLDFYIAHTNCQRPYSIWWKVRNVGSVAECMEWGKSGIQDGKSDIQDGKSDIGVLRADIDNRFTAKTTKHILKLREEFQGQTIFGRSDVMRVLDMKASRTSELLKEMAEQGIIEPVSGFGKENIGSGAVGQ